MLEPHEDDVRWMRQALALAKQGIGTTHPNPRVGAVVVKDGVLLGEGWHRCAGEPHAEVHALADAGAQARGATIYVTLEPCSATGRTPACTQAIMQAGIARVVFASSDVNPQMAAGGAYLQQRGVEVCAGVLADEADALNRAFFHYIRHGRAWIALKAAISLDGKLATRTHDSQWITGAEARQHVHQMRAQSDAIVVGAGTLRDDNPSLTVRDAPLRGTPPLRVVLARTTPECLAHYQLLNTQEAASRIYVYQHNEHSAAWQDAGVEVMQVDDLKAVFQHLAEDGCLQVMVEGGGQIHAALLEHDLADELLLYQAPVLIGGVDAVNLWHGRGVAMMSDALRFKDVQRQMLGQDCLIRADIH